MLLIDREVDEALIIDGEMIVRVVEVVGKTVRLAVSSAQANFPVQEFVLTVRGTEHEEEQFLPVSEYLGAGEHWNPELTEDGSGVVSYR